MSFLSSTQLGGKLERGQIIAALERPVGEVERGAAGRGRGRQKILGRGFWFCRRRPVQLGGRRFWCDVFCANTAAAGTTSSMASAARRARHRRQIPAAISIASWHRLGKDLGRGSDRWCGAARIGPQPIAQRHEVGAGPRFSGRTLRCHPHSRHKGSQANQPTIGRVLPPHRGRAVTAGDPGSPNMT